MTFKKVDLTNGDVAMVPNYHDDCNSDDWDLHGCGPVMNTNSHTPGPWEVQITESESGIWPRIISPSEYSKGRGGLIINEIIAKEKGEEMANARLIACAPEMLEALYRALPYVETALEDQGYKPGAVSRMVKFMTDTIAKAEGRG